MFAPPPAVDAEIFARLPDRYRDHGRDSEWLRRQLRNARRHSLLEGPSFDRSGNLYVVDVPFGRIFRVSPHGEFDLVADYDGEPNGLKIHRDGRIFVADHKHGILRLDPETGSVTAVCDRPRLERFIGVNDLVFAGNGDLYFTDQGQSGLHDPAGRVFRLRADGTLDCLMRGIPSPNGLVPSLDETALFVAVTRDNAVWRLPFMLDGSVSKAGAFIRLSGGVGPDGMALTADGGLAVAHIGLGAVWLFDPRGEPILRVNAKVGLSVTNLAFGGADLRDLFITEADSGCILRVRTPVAGKPMFSHQ